MLCQKCKKREVTDLHHVDGNHKNNDPDNLMEVCTLCHAKIHGNFPKKSELKRLIIFRDRAIKVRNVLNNQKDGFGRIEYLVPEMWEGQTEKWGEFIAQKEKEIKRCLEKNNYPILDWLLGIKGVGHVMAGKLIAWIDIENTPSVTSLWNFCGVGTKDGKRRQRKKRMSQDKAKKCGNPYLKKELLGVLATSLLRQKAPKYYEIYKERREHTTKTNPDWTKGHSSNDGKRIMIKEFLKDLYAEWREGEGLKATLTWEEVENREK